MFVVVGTANVDLVVSGMERLPRGEGDEFTGSSLVFCDRPLQMTLGGNGGNSAYVLARLGAPVALCSAVGRDALGDTLAGWLTDVGVDVGALARFADHATASTTMLADPAGHRLSFHHAGASWAFGPTDVRPGLIEGADVVLASSWPLLRGWRPDGFREILSLARRGGAITALDIGPAIERPATLDELRPTLPDVRFFLSNAHELAVCTGADDVAEGMARVLEAGAGCVVVKRGAEGALVRTSAEAEAQAVPGFAVEANATVGAGDAFNAGFLVGIQAGWPPVRAARFGNATAALVVSSKSGVLGAPDRHQVQALLGE